MHDQFSACDCEGHSLEVVNCTKYRKKPPDFCYSKGTLSWFCSYFLPLLVFMTSHCIQSLTMMILYNNAQYMKKFFAYYYSTYQDSFPILPPSSCCLYLIASIRNVSVVPAFQLLYAFEAIQLLSVFLTSALRAVSNNQ